AMFYTLYERGNFIPYAVLFGRRHLARKEPFSERYRSAPDFRHHLWVAHDYRIHFIDHPLTRMRDDGHPRLSDDSERMFAEHRAILKEVHRRYADRPPRITRQLHARAMSEQYRAEA